MAMFNRDDHQGRTVETTVGPSVKVEGNFVGSGNIIVEGIVSGSLKTSRDVRIGEAAKVKADIEAANLIVLGEVQGNVRVSGRLELGPASRVTGNVETAVLVIAQGASLNGKCLMAKHDAAATAAPAEAPAIPEKHDRRRST